jgi:mono/diheme cytochrome c family protein
MKQPLNTLLFVLLIGTVALVACGGEATADPAQEPSIQVTPPSEYATLVNPNSISDIAAVEAGKTLYKTNCTSCHGEEGKGDGPATTSLDPKPANLADNMGSFSDGYLYWRISAGGQMPPFNSAMPAWKDIFTKEQIWQIITYMRTFSP